jgi:two-component system, NtrC family, nitrogen regulation sensor histidine kinase NtrY
LLIEDEGLAEYLDETYFSGYFSQYELRIMICSGADSFLVETDNQMAPCIDFFEDMIETQGIEFREPTSFSWIT